MNSKLRSLMVMSSMMAISAGIGGNLFDSEQPKRKRVLSINERKKCFRSGCNNLRNSSSSLYCSDECQKIYHEELKNSETK